MLGQPSQTLFLLRRRKDRRNAETPSSFSHLSAKTILNYLLVANFIGSPSVQSQSFTWKSLGPEEFAT